jgi:mono/diheme cytochrome c family protein
VGTSQPYYPSPAAMRLEAQRWGFEDNLEDMLSTSWSPSSASAETISPAQAFTVSSLSSPNMGNTPPTVGSSPDKGKGRATAELETTTSYDELVSKADMADAWPYRSESTYYVEDSQGLDPELHPHDQTPDVDQEDMSTRHLLPQPWNPAKAESISSDDMTSPGQISLFTCAQCHSTFPKHGQLK